MQADAELATGTMAAGSFWRTSATVYLGMAHLMADDSDQADVLFEDAAAEAAWRPSRRSLRGAGRTVAAGDR